MRQLIPFAMKRGSHIKGDLQGGLVSSIMVIAKAIPLGVLVFAPFGPEYVAMGTFAAMISVIFSNLGSVMLRGNAVVINGPYSPTTLMLVSAASLTIARAGMGELDSIHTPLAIVLIFLIVFASGFFQVMLGLFRVGFIAKYVSYPVIAGLVNGSGILVILAQVRPILGVAPGVSWRELLLSPGMISMPTLMVGVVTLLLLWKGNAVIRQIPAEFIGLIGGTLFFYLLRYVGYGPAEGGTVGQIAGGIPTPRFLVGFLEIMRQGRGLALVTSLMPVIFSITLINSLHSLMLDTMVGQLTDERPDSNRELINQGVGNMLCGAFGGIGASGVVPATLAGYRNGGRTTGVKMFSGLFALLILVMASPALSLLPLVVLAALLLKAGIDLFDTWSLTLLDRLVTRQTRAFPTMDALIVLTVTVVSVAVGIFEAVALGVLLSVVQFMVRMGKEIVAREYDATRMRSNVIRPDSEIAFLETEGHKIHVLELQGALFFGTADKLADRIESAIQANGRKVQYVILDFRKVREIDATGANLLQQMCSRWEKNGVFIMFSSVADNAMWQRYEAFGMGVSTWQERLFPDIDAALASAEDHLLDAALGADREQREKRLEEIPVLRDLDEAEFALLLRLMKRRSFKAGDLLYRQGDPGDDLYFILRGRVGIEVTPPGDHTCYSVAVLCSGMMVGEMALLDGQPRSADVRAINDLVCVSLSKADMDLLTKTYPDTAIKLYKGFALTFSYRMRVANRINTELRG